MLNGRTTIEEAWYFEFTIDNQRYKIVKLAIKNKLLNLLMTQIFAGIFDTQFYHPAK